MYEANTDAKQRAALDARRKYREVVTTQKNKIARLEQENEMLRARVEALESAQK